MSLSEEASNSFSENQSEAASLFETGGRGLELAHEEVDAARAVGTAASQTLIGQRSAQERLEDYFNGEFRDRFPNQADGYFNPRREWEALGINVVSRLTGENGWWAKSWQQFGTDVQRFTDQRFNEVSGHLESTVTDSDQRLRELHEIKDWVSRLRQFPADLETRLSGPDGLRSDLLREVGSIDRNLQVSISATRGINDKHPSLGVMVETWHQVQNFQEYLSDWFKNTGDRLRAFNDQATSPAGRVSATFGEVEYLSLKAKK